MGREAADPSAAEQVASAIKPPARIFTEVGRKKAQKAQKQSLSFFASSALFCGQNLVRKRDLASTRPLHRRHRASGEARNLNVAPLGDFGDF